MYPDSSITYRNGYILNKKGEIIGNYANGHIFDKGRNIKGFYSNGFIYDKNHNIIGNYNNGFVTFKHRVNVLQTIFQWRVRGFVSVDIWRIFQTIC